MALHGALRILRRQYGLMLLCVILVTGVAYASAATQKKEYSATALLLFHDPGYANILFGSSAGSVYSDPTRDAATDLDLVSLHAVAARTASALGGGMTAGSVGGEISVAAQGQSNTVAVTATEHSPQFAAQLATTYAQQFIAFRRDAARAQLVTAQQVVQNQLNALPLSARSGSTAAGLQNRANQLQILAALQTGNAELVQRAPVPTSPSAPAPRRTALIGLFLGIVLAILVALFRERLDRRLREIEEIEEIFDRPILGSIPQSKALGAGNSSSELLPGREREAFMLLSTSLRYFDVNRKIKTMMITSAASGDGKTTVARNLAAASAFAGGNVLLIEADLRHPVLANLLGLPAEPGLSEFLAGHASGQEAVVRVSLAPDGHPMGDVHFDLFRAGRMPPNPTDLLSSEQMRTLLEAATKHYSQVIIDTPPTAVVSDAIPLLSIVDGVIVVARLNKTTRDSLRHLQRHLERLGAPIMGLAINGTTRQVGYGTPYDYHYVDATPAVNGTANMPVDAASRFGG